MTPTKTHATYADLAAVPDTHVAELIDGELFVTPRPAVRHATASFRLGGILDQLGRQGGDHPDGWVFLAEPEMRFANATVNPDLAGWRRRNFPVLAAGEDQQYFTQADWVCEVASPSTERWDRTKKMRVYADARIAQLWLIQPLLKTLEAYSLGRNGRWSLIDVYSDGLVRIEPFDAFEFNLNDLWL